MTAHALIRQSGSTVVSRSAVDILIERLAKSLLAWSDRRAAKNQLTHERMALLIENQRSSTRGGSGLGR